ncbi:MAG TPA: hypothetical protein VG099_24020 [Gemmataceae bacterium]|nr:hypothetical protein [Gemmataceae bacterium]
MKSAGVEVKLQGAERRPRFDEPENVLVACYLSELSYAWQRIAKTRGELKQEDAALAAFQEATKPSAGSLK